MNNFKLVTLFSLSSLLVACGGNSNSYLSAKGGPGSDYEMVIPDQKPNKNDKEPQLALDSDSTLLWIAKNTLSNRDGSVDLRLKTRKNGADGEGDFVDVKLSYDKDGNFTWASPVDVESLVIPSTKSNSTGGVTSAYGFVLPVDGELTAFSISENIDSNVKAALDKIAVSQKVNYSGTVSGVTLDKNNNLVVQDGLFSLTIDVSDYTILGTIEGINQSSGAHAFGNAAGLVISGKVYNDYFSGTITGDINGKKGSSDLVGQFTNGGKNITGHWNGDFTGGLTGQKGMPIGTGDINNQPLDTPIGKHKYTNVFTSYDGLIKEVKAGKKSIVLKIEDADGLSEHSVRIEGDKDSFISSKDLAGGYMVTTGSAVYSTDNGYYGITRARNSENNGWLQTFNVADTTDPSVIQDLRDNAVANNKVTYNGVAHGSDSIHEIDGFKQSNIEKGNVTIDVDFLNTSVDGKFDGASIFKDGLVFDGNFNDKGVITAKGGFVNTTDKDINVNAQFAGEHGEEIIGSFTADYYKAGNTIAGGFSANKK